MPPSRLRGRPRRTTYLYEDEEHPDRVTGTIEGAEWTRSDRALMLALDQHEATLCRCGQPKRTAWQVSGQHTTHQWECDGCTEIARGEAEARGEDRAKVKPVTYIQVYRRHDAPADLDDQPPLRIPTAADLAEAEKAKADLPPDWFT